MDDYEEEEKYSPTNRKAYTGKLRERSAYYFQVIRTTTDPEGDEYFLMQDPFGTRHLVPIVFYKDYNIEIGSTIKAFVDKINCAGKVFIEPDHPLYKIGDIHTFPFLRHDRRVNKDGLLIPVLVVADIYHRECTILPQEWQTDATYQPQGINCQIERIKKGRLYLVNNEPEKPDPLD